MLHTSFGQSFSNEPQLITFQLYFSTADVERSIFFAGENNPDLILDQIPDTTILIIHGNPYVLIEETPQQAIPLTAEAGIFRPLDID
jgi:hypothetical protein